MKIYYIVATGEIVQAVLERDDFWFKNTIQDTYDVLEIDELDPENKDLCIDLVKTDNKVDADGLKKYYISGGVLYQRDGWEEVENG